MREKRLAIRQLIEMYFGAFIFIIITILIEQASGTAIQNWPNLYFYAYYLPSNFLITHYFIRQQYLVYINYREEFFKKKAK